MKYHGEFKINVVGRVAEIKATGAWNGDTANKYVENFKILTKKLRISPWGALIDITEWEMATPETEKIIADLQIWCMKNNQRYEATVAGESELKKCQSDKYYQYLDTDAFTQRYFISSKEAVEWLSKIGLYEI